MSEGKCDNAMTGADTQGAVASVESQTLFLEQSLNRLYLYIIRNGKSRHPGHETH